MSRSRQRGEMQSVKCGKRMMAVLILALCLIVGGSVSPLLAASRNSSLSPVDYSFVDLEPAVDQLIIVDVDRGIQLFSKQADLPRSLGISNHLMTAMLALNALEPDALITLSLEAAAYADDQDKLQAGQRYTLDYLLYAMLLEDEEAAAYAIGERVAGQPELFVAQMNEQAGVMGLNNTVYTQIQGTAAPGQYSTAADTAELTRKLLANPNFRNIFAQKEYFYYDGKGSRAYFENAFSLAWTVLPGTVGASLALDDNASSGVVSITDRVKGFDYLVVFNLENAETSLARNRALISDLQAISQSISLAYEESRLVTAGSVYLRDQEISGVGVDLVFLDTLSYVHPAGDDFLYEHFYLPLDPAPELPIYRGQTVGQVTFVLSDGTSIVAGVGPAEDIRSENARLDQLFTLMDENRDLVILILVLAAFLLIALLAALPRRIRQLGYMISLRALNRERRDLIRDGAPRSRRQHSAANLHLRSDSETPFSLRQRFQRLHPQHQAEDATHTDSSESDMAAELTTSVSSGEEDDTVQVRSGSK